MKLTTRSSYGVRALVNLAIMYDDGHPVSIKYVSRKEGISSIYLEQIFNRLKKQGIVRSIRGPKGGYSLSKDPSQISVYEVVLALEGRVSPARCFSDKKEMTVCKRAGKCASKEVWDEVARHIKDALESFSLKDLAKRTLQIDPENREKAISV
jgi:Rrf2 family protein